MALRCDVLAEQTKDWAGVGVGGEQGGRLPAPSPSLSTQGWPCLEFPHPQHVWDAEGKLEGRVPFGITTMGFPGSSAGKESTCSAGDSGSIPGLGRSPGEGNSYPLQYSDLENSMDCVANGDKESDTTERLSLSPWRQNSYQVSPGWKGSRKVWFF